MRFDVITLFPEMVVAPASESIVGRARQAGKIEVVVHDLRDWTEGKHKAADDSPFGGGDGMVMKPEPVVRAVRAAKELAPHSPVVLTSPQGRRLDQDMATELASLSGLIIVCGHYAGIDERAVAMAVDREISIGDYVLSGGEPAAVVIIDAVSRLVPGVLGNAVSAEDDSFPHRLEYPQYTRPAEFEGVKVPEVLLSGHHEKVRRWRKKESLRRTMERRPDLIGSWPLDDEEKELLAELLNEGDKAWD